MIVSVITTIPLIVFTWFTTEPSRLNMSPPTLARYLEIHVPIQQMKSTF